MKTAMTIDKLPPHGPLCDRRWAMAMQWHDLLFMHWPLPAEALRPLVPRALTLDTYDGQAWLGVTPFHMSGVRHRLTPAVPGVSAFPELNVRTYVTYGGRPGVWFFSLDAGNAPAVWTARWMYGLPYYRARMRVEQRDGWIYYSSRRTHFGSHGEGFIGRYRPVGDVFRSAAGSLEEWLTERYSLYTCVPRRGLGRVDIDHVRWPLQLAEAQVELNTMTEPLNVTLPDIPPLLHFCRHLDVVGWPLRWPAQEALSG